MTSETSTPPAASSEPSRRAHIGPYVLESLTTGMYGEPRHTIREYVQNAFDAIETARDSGTLQKSEGRVVITIDRTKNSIFIRDNGSGIRSENAWSTLSAIGASAKERSERAGFRGIGRLAGLAYCNTLKFITKHRSDVRETTVTFDCVRLRKEMDPAESTQTDIQTLLTDTVKDTYRTTSETERTSHYTEVVLEGIDLAPDEMKDVDKLSSYLSQTAPVKFYPKLWSHEQKIENFAAEFGKPIKTIELFIRQKDFADPLKTGDDDEISDNEFQIFKPYRNHHTPKGKKEAVEVSGVTLLADTSGENKWWGWIGDMPTVATLNDTDAAGLRVRSKNIQIDGTDIMERLFAESRVSYARFNKWFIGEFHILSDDVVPNARRDSFEENDAWRGIQDEFVPILQDLTKRTYKASKVRNERYKRFKRSADAITEAVEKRLTLPVGVDGGNDPALLLHIDEIYLEISAEISKDITNDEDTRTLKLMLAAVNENRRRLQRQLAAKVDADVLSERTGTEERILRVVWSVMQEMVDPVLYKEARREIERRLAI
ncbi:MULTISPECIES: ATP-binding protein [Rhizobium/Agrobacterium group]|uniref:ATP-binding protein n=1 Tax=Rhizobium/Agrobacterium group TaxID=227290 RepID=UPI001ADB958F|nr:MULTISPECIES: ATP-binding protein [Rhizobium/Agrobacterium group]MBO9111750.1 ATP-binding protein [Agrobacterium sp. S2/73]QXZ76681.1 ATP-binding protein [Agrobacterium sp. S7/73]QYA17154.1 ATP-binding protein [Rhizobium sp. AB2/73]UEQ85273.1 ATP-binding protein [Rhizobium sp. AB2/73]